MLRALENEDWPEWVNLVDGGTGGFHLLSYLRDYKRIILVDATRDGEPPGTVQSFSPKLAGDFPPSLGAHDIGLKDLIGAAALLGPLPQMAVVTISIEELTPMSMELSPAVSAAIPQATCLVRELLPCLGGQVLDQCQRDQDSLNQCQ